MQHRPKYHFLPEKNWMNDPNGPIWVNGEHHLFYQYNPTDWRWGNLHWGHAVSKDLVHWEHKPIALYPALDRGETNCYSGSAFLNDGKIDIMYTSVGAGERGQISGSEQWIATTQDNITWEQIEENPILKRSDHGDKVLTQWRDPFLFDYKGKKYLLVAGIVDGKYGATHIYRSDDLRHWTYMNEFFHNDTASEIMECPNVVIFGDKVLFMFSVWNQREIRYYIGTIKDDFTFEPESEGRIDYGEFFASQISFDENGRTMLWGWLREAPRNLMYTDGEWAGVQAFPRVISLNEKNELVIKRLPEIATLRKGKESVSLKGFSGKHTFETKSNTVEIIANIKTDKKFSFRVLESGDGDEYAEIWVDPLNGTMGAVLNKSSLLDGVDKEPLCGKFRKREDGSIFIDILVDCSLLEVFINDNGCISPRVYPTLEEKKISFKTDGVVERADISVYEMAL